MDIYRAFKLISRYFWLLVTVPLFLGGLMILITKSQPKVFYSKATIFTGISSGHSIESQGRDRVDYFAVTVAFDNMTNILKSKNVLEEVGLRLFTQNIMLKTPHPRLISDEEFKDLQSITPDELKNLIVNDNFNETLLRFKEYKNKNEDNFLYELLNLEHEHYSFEGLSTVEARRIQGSDLLEISYQSSDPGITYQTLIILIDVFLHTYSELKMTQTSTVVQYFEQQLNNTWVKLVVEENRLLDFNKANQIINYQEQTKFVASQKEQYEIAVQSAQMEYGAAASVLERLEAEINSRHNVNLKTQNIWSLRNELLRTNHQIERFEISQQKGTFIEPSENLYSKRKEIEDQIKQAVESLFILDRNIDGVEQKYIISQWFENVLQLENAAARLKVLNNKRIEFDNLYMFFAPLGATINRIERAIGVLEREYLSILHNLGLAKLKQQNLELSASMDILDEPFFPISTQPSKRMLYVLFITVFSFLFVLIAVFVTEMLDRRLKTVKILETLTGLKAAGAVLREKINKKVDIPLLSYQAITDLVSNVLQSVETQTNNTSCAIIQVFSNWRNEGKTFFIQKAMLKLEQLDYAVAVFHIGDPSEDEILPPNTWYISEKQYQTIKSFSEYLNELNNNPWSNYDFLLIEIPVVSEVIINKSICQASNLNLLLANASRTWSSADDHYLEKLKAASQGQLLAVLNNITPDNIEEYIGEIPKKRSSFRVFIKNRLIKRYTMFKS